MILKGKKMFTWKVIIHTLTCEKGVVNMAVKLNNKLPIEIRKEEGERKFKRRLKGYLFKRRLKGYLLEHPYYTLQEFLSEGQ
jgi:hypothetical protein